MRHAVEPEDKDNKYIVQISHKGNGQENYADQEEIQGRILVHILDFFAPELYIYVINKLNVEAGGVAGGGGGEGSKRFCRFNFLHSGCLRCLRGCVASAGTVINTSSSSYAHIGRAGLAACLIVLVLTTMRIIISYGNVCFRYQSINNLVSFV